MAQLEEKMLYRVIAQKEGITIKAETAYDVTMKEAKEVGISEVLGGIDKAVSFEHLVALPITTKDRWERGVINFCPRCGANLHDYDLDDYASFDCFECDRSVEVQIFSSTDDEFCEE